MEQDWKFPQSPLSTLRSESDDSSLADRSPRQTIPRFTRSGSKSRSKSRDPHEEVPSGFFVKRANRPSSPLPADSPVPNRFLRTAGETPRRELTPSRRRSGVCGAGEEVGELEWVALERRCQVAEAESLRLQKLNKSLQSRLAEIEADRRDLQERLSVLQPSARPRTNNLLKLRQEISRQRQAEPVPCELSQQLEALQSEVQVLRERLRASESAAESSRGQRERFLQGLVQELRREGRAREGLLERVRTQVDVLRVREARQADRSEQLRSEELQVLKRKYGNILMKYHEASQQLAAERRGRRVEEGSLCERTSAHSLSLSP